MQKALTLTPADGPPGAMYMCMPLQLSDVPRPQPGPGQVLVRMHAAALNHRDLFVRQRLYPGIAAEQPMLADGCGAVVAVGSNTSSPSTAGWLGRAVLLAPARGWASDPAGPEDLRAYSVIGSTGRYPGAGTAQEYVAVDAADVEPAPAHLSAAEAAALPLAGLTAWRALVTKCFGGSVAAARGRNVLVTGVGGGVALQVVQFAVALGCGVYVTSGDERKIERARAMGARGGVSYRDGDWHKRLKALLPKDRPFLDAVVDGAGGEIVVKSVALLKPGGIISCYGMTLSPMMDWPMQAVLKNIELRGSTMGSRREFHDMVQFVADNEIRPVVSRVVHGLDNLKDIDELFEDMKEGKQFGKLVIQITPPGQDTPAKL